MKVKIDFFTECYEDSEVCHLANTSPFFEKSYKELGLYLYEWSKNGPYIVIQAKKRFTKQSELVSEFLGFEFTSIKNSLDQI